MNSIVEDKRLITKVCAMYYVSDLSQKEIASLLHLSRPTISRMIANGKKMGIVDIKINSSYSTKYVQLECELEKRFKLDEVVITDVDASEEQTKENVSRAAAALVGRLLKSGQRIGVTMGSTIAQIPGYLTGTKAKDLTVIPLIGGLGSVRMKLNSNAIAEDFAGKLGADYLLMNAPARVSDLRTKEALIKENSIKEVLEACEDLDIAVCGIGAPDASSAIIKTGFISSQELEKLKEDDVAGDICMQFFDPSGSTKRFSDENSVIGLDIKKLKNVKYSIGVACTPKKTRAVLGAIRGKFVNYLVIDEACAKSLLED